MQKFQKDWKRVRLARCVPPGILSWPEEDTPVLWVHALQFFDSAVGSSSSRTDLCVCRMLHGIISTASSSLDLSPCSLLLGFSQGWRGCWLSFQTPVLLQTVQSVCLQPQKVACTWWGLCTFASPVLRWALTLIEPSVHIC
jgi:hypothetical protein